MLYSPLLQEAFQLPGFVRRAIVCFNDLGDAQDCKSLKKMFLHIHSPFPCVGRSKDCTGESVHRNMHIKKSAEGRDVRHVHLPHLTARKASRVSSRADRWELVGLALGTCRHDRLGLFTRKLELSNQVRGVLMELLVADLSLTEQIQERGHLNRRS